jgi:hypothetical protein
MLSRREAHAFSNRVALGDVELVFRLLGKNLFSEYLLLTPSLSQREWYPYFCSMPHSNSPSLSQNAIAGGV